MDIFPILVDGNEVDTGTYIDFPDMNKVAADPGIALSLQLRAVPSAQRFLLRFYSKGGPELRYLRDYRKHHGEPNHAKDELDEAIIAKVSQSRESDIQEALVAGTRDHLKLFNPLRQSGQGLSIDDRVDALYQAGLDVKKRYEEIRDISVSEGVPIGTFNWTWDMFTEYLSRDVFALWGQDLDVIESYAPYGGKNYRFREPYGIACLFTPYNSPLALGILSITSSILAGNATILKPPSKVPLSTIILGRIFMERFLDLGMPPAMVQVLTGGGKTLMDRFMSDSSVGTIVWYGDSDRGFELWSKSMRKRIQLAPELAGSDASLVWGKDVDLEFAAKMIVKGRFLGSGQACMAVKRLLVQEDLHDELVRLVVEEAEKLKIGLPSDTNASLPPLGLTALYLLVDQMEDALARGAQIKTGGYRCNFMSEPDPAGLFYKPTVLTDVTLDMRIMQEEVFAPALPVLKVKSVDEAIQVANSSRFGLRSSLFTDDSTVRQKWVKEIQAGGVTLGHDHLYFDPQMPHLGGYKDSGIIGAKFFHVMLTRMKYVHVGKDVQL
jgi:lactaldehyde dehydrogenase